MWRYHFRKKERSQNTFKRSSKWQFRSCVDHVQSVRRSSRKGVRLRKQLLQSTQLERSETAMIWLQAAHIWSEQRSNCTNAMIIKTTTIIHVLIWRKITLLRFQREARPAGVRRPARRRIGAMRNSNFIRTCSENDLLLRQGFWILKNLPNRAESERFVSSL